MEIVPAVLIMRLQLSVNAKHECFPNKKFLVVRPDLAVLNLISDLLELWVQRGHSVGQKGQRSVLGKN